MVELNLQRDNLNFVEGHTNQLTIGAQEKLKRALLDLAKRQVAQNEATKHKDVRCYYYEALASFMNEYPSVQIDLILIKLDEFPLN